MNEDFVADGEATEDDSRTQDFIRQLADLNEQLRKLRSDNQPLSETIIRMCMKDVGVLN